MSDEVIKRALDAAWKGMCMSIHFAPICDDQPCSLCRDGSAAAIAAFLREMEVIQHMKTDEGWIDIAAAIERAQFSNTNEG